MAREIDLNEAKRLYAKTLRLGEEAASSIVNFFNAEFELFDISLGEILKYDELGKNTQRIIDYLRERMFFPLHTNLEFYKEILPNLKLMLENIRKKFAFLSHNIEQNPQVKSIDIEDLFEEHRQSLENLEGIVKDSEEKVPIFLDFSVRLLDKIVEKARQQKIFTFTDYLINDINIRDKIYRASLRQEDSWLLGYDLKLLMRIALYVAKDNEMLVRTYRSLKEDIKSGGGVEDLDALLANSKITFIFPEPLGAEVISRKKLYEEILPYIESIREYRALDKAVKNHFEKRAEQIFK